MNPPGFVPEDGEVVLVVDDNEPLRESLIRVLKSAGIRSVGASSVQEALRLQAVHLPRWLVSNKGSMCPSGSRQRLGMST